MRVLMVIGCVSGGTSATAGALAGNGFFCEGRAPYFEGAIARRVFSIDPAPPERLPNYREVKAAIELVAGIRERAGERGEKAAVLKCPNGPVWRAPLVDMLDVEPLLVWREPSEVLASIERRWGQSRRGAYFAEWAPKILQRIEELHEEKGWPLFRFSKASGQSELERIVGVDLPEPVIKPGVQTK